MTAIQDHIRIVPDFPKPGINFYDIATLIAHPAAFQLAVQALKVKATALRPDKLMGVEARGFLFAAPLAAAMGCGLGMVRKKGKLPGETLSYSYALEYGTDTVEVQPDLIAKGERILLIDDLLATGGTLAAAENLLNQAGAEVVGALCVIELEGLNGRVKLNCPFEALLQCPA